MEICGIKLLEIPAGVLEMVQLSSYSPTAGLISTVSQMKISITASGRILNGSAQCCPERMCSEDTPSASGSMED